LAEKKALELSEIEGIGVEEDDEEADTQGKDDIDGKNEAKGNKRKRKGKASKIDAQLGQLDATDTARAYDS